MPAIRKAVILARGLGKRMRRPDESAPLSAAQTVCADLGMKAMIPIGRPFLDYALSAVADAGFEEACLVIGPEHDAVREYYSRTAPPRRIAVSFAVQPEPRGTADAVLAAESFARAEDFLVLNSDNYYPVGALSDLCRLGEPGLALFEQLALVREGNIRPDRIRAFAFGRVGEDGYLQDLIEKPDDATLASLGPEALVSMNAWRFSPDIFDVCRAAPLSPRGEYELPSAVALALRQGRLRLRAVRAAGGILDLSQRGDVAEVAARLRGVEANP